MIEKTPSGRFRARLKSGRHFVASKTFDTKREAAEWLARERAALAGGIDPKSGQRRVREVVAEWLEMRAYTVSTKTYRSDQALRRLMPTSLQALKLSAVSEREVARSYEALIKAGLSESSVVRYRASLSSFFGWCVRERLIRRNPVTGTKVPRSSEEPVEMRPWDEEELERAHETWRAHNAHLADVLLLLAWTGLRWGEARAVTVEDIVEVPTPGLLIRRSQPEGVAVKSTKGRRSRRVPLANRVLPIVRRMQLGKDPDELLITTVGGAKLHRSAVLRAVKWSETGQGRRVHDLRHTAACLWLARSVDPGTVQAWMGHESIATTNRYLHFLGTSADRAGLHRLNEPAPSQPAQSQPAPEPRGYAGGTRREASGESHD